MIDSLMLSATRISTLAAEQVLTNASGFFFQRDDRLFLVTSRHVVFDAPSGHRPDALRIEHVSYTHLDVYKRQWSCSPA